MTFEIAGMLNARALHQTRHAPAGAILLAERWLREGVEDVRIAWNDRVFDLHAFRNRFILTSRGLKPRVTIGTDGGTDGDMP